VKTATVVMITTQPSGNSTISIKKIEDKQRRGRNLPTLLALLVIAVILLGLTRWFLFRKPPLPPHAASPEVQRRYWQDRIKQDVSDRDAYLNLGILEEKNGFYVSARRNLESARTLGVPDTEISSYLGRTLMHLAEPEKAQQEMEKAISLFPKKWETVANLSGFYINNNNITKANEVLGTFWNCVERKVLSQSELERLTLAFLECDNPKSALEVARFLVEKDTLYPGGQILVARCAFATKDDLLARTAVEAALKATPDESAALYFYGLVLQRLKDYDGALTAWQKANTINPSASDAYERIGEEYRRRGDFLKAAHALERIALADSQISSAAKVAELYMQAKEPVDAAYWEAVVAGLQQNYPKALEFAQKATQTANPIKKRRGLSAVAEAYRGMEKREEYLTTVLQATAAGTVDDLLLRAHTYDILEKYQLRLDCLQQIIQKDPQQEVAMRYERALIFEKMGSRDESEKELERAVVLNDKNAQCMQELARIYLLRSSVDGRLDKATALIEKSVALNPDQESSWLTLGQCYANKNMLGKAARCIEHAIDLEAGNGPAYLELSRVYARSGNTKGSQEMMQQYQKYVAFEQQRQTLRTKARRKDATATDLTAYADLLMNVGDANEALRQYEKAYEKNTQDKALKNTLRILYKKMSLPERLARLEGMTL
jgi:tetratricopeptide (TPR) repeat protein